MGDIHAFYEAPKAVYRPTHQIQAPLRFWDGSTLKTGKMLLIQRFFPAIQYRSVFHVPLFFFFFFSGLKARRKQRQSLEHDLFLRVENTPLTNLRRGERGRQTERVKQKWRIL